MKPARQTSATRRDIELAGESPIESVAGRERPVIDDQRLDARRARPLEPAGIGAIRDDDRDRRRETSFRNRVDERLKIAATARDEHADSWTVR